MVCKNMTSLTFWLPYDFCKAYCSSLIKFKNFFSTWPKIAWLVSFYNQEGMFNIMWFDVSFFSIWPKIAWLVSFYNKEGKFNIMWFEVSFFSTWLKIACLVSFYFQEGKYNTEIPRLVWFFGPQQTALIEHWFSTKIAIWDFWVFKVHFFLHIFSKYHFLKVKNWLLGWCWHDYLIIYDQFLLFYVI